MRGRRRSSNAMRRMTAMPNRNYDRIRESFAYRPCGVANRRISFRENLEMPALRVGDQKIAEYLDTGDRLEFFRVDEIGVERERLGFAE